MKTWNIDTAHSEIGFKVKHLMISTVRGLFSSFEGSISAQDESFDNGQISFSSDVSSIDTKNAQRDGHLKSADFFDAENFPKLTFSSTSVKNVGDNNLEITGDLTMRGVTKSVSLNASVTGVVKGMDGAQVAGFEISGKINRSEFGLVWNAPLETGGVVVSDSVTIEALIEAKEQA